MSLTFRRAAPEDYETLKALVVDSFLPITWFCKVDRRFGPLNGLDCHARWELRFGAVFASQIVIVGEENGQALACATGTYDPATRLGYVDLLAVRNDMQGHGYGREMLRGMLAHFKALGAMHAHLDCLADNDVGNNLYRAEGFEEMARSVKWMIRIPES